ncbi:hypothetical protein QAD02_005751 [Eretmocerus hayati]|uniref:Uncharacterized protein n=1 Tax=Eretmocerus hayati TaxID=131215 RepID=A0ACC2NTS6_9HYME|nr:hypothetical protein QAD02_005751 [Eretmocerus hayati]
MMSPEKNANKLAHKLSNYESKNKCREHVSTHLVKQDCRNSEDTDENEEESRQMIRNLENHEQCLVIDYDLQNPYLLTPKAKHNRSTDKKSPICFFEKILDKSAGQHINLRCLVSKVQKPREMNVLKKLMKVQQIEVVDKNANEAKLMLWNKACEKYHTILKNNTFITIKNGKIGTFHGKIVINITSSTAIKKTFKRTSGAHESEVPE